MSGATEIAGLAPKRIEELVEELIASDYAENEVALGTLISGNTEIQVQLRIVSVPQLFIEED
ncbi:hypothetical protein [Vibrio parahaemolyticus]|uniref:hypothetical protein n=1 Tax=Vibrio parahaemolyticus TaxID=670 RepID=UPI00226A967A|nr:hypothetical protein [Vibrio parahaemolyticus]MCX8827938.1 hypothetical protein [Vibrio parahaemolyticus]MCX8928688.1 hypothetical protein [Vibrio parahaemolyticus]